MADRILTALEVIREDWSKLPNFVKYCFLVASSVIISIWLLKGQDKEFDKATAIWGFVVLGMFGVIFPALYWLFVTLKIQIFRTKYPVTKMGNGIYFVSIGNPVYLVDAKRKQLRWIENPRTLYDLGFFPYVWTIVVPVTSLSESVSINSRSFDLSKYKILRGLRTRYRIKLR